MGPREVCLLPVLTERVKRVGWTFLVLQKAGFWSGRTDTDLLPRSPWAMVQRALVGLLFLLIVLFTEAQVATNISSNNHLTFQIAKKACTCNGFINARGQGECRTAFKVIKNFSDHQQPSQMFEQMKAGGLARSFLSLVRCSGIPLLLCWRQWLRGWNQVQL